MDDEELPSAGKGLATLAFLSLVTSFLLPWWGVRYRVEGASGSLLDGVGLFRDHVYVSQVLTVLSGLAVAAAVLLLFVRVAARSWQYEPASWRRDLWVAAGLAGLAVLLAVFWPTGYPYFWGGPDYGVPPAAGTYQEAAQPLLGWWCAVLGTLASVAAAWRARTAASSNDK